MLIDTHCHLDFPQFDHDRPLVIGRARENNIGYLINIGSSISGSQKSVELARQYDFIYASVGIHPHEADRFNDEAREALCRLAKEDKVVAIGEIGLDYYKNYSQPENQKLLFGSLLKLAKGLGLPAVVHSRQAQIDTLKILKEMMPLEAVVHCFSGDEDFLKQCLDAGFFISFTCNITYKNAAGLRHLVELTPIERIFLETDAPYLAPQELRGERNEPANVKLLAAEVARLKQLSEDEVADITTSNAKLFFGLK